MHLVVPAQRSFLPVHAQKADQTCPQSRATYSCPLGLVCLDTFMNGEGYIHARSGCTETMMHPCLPTYITGVPDGDGVGLRNIQHTEQHAQCIGKPIRHILKVGITVSNMKLFLSGG